MTGTGKTSYYCNAVNITPINGSLDTSVTEYFNGGSSSISTSIASSQVTVQQLAIYYNGANYIVLSNVSAFY